MTGPITLGTQIGDNPVDLSGISGDSGRITCGFPVSVAESSAAGHRLSALSSHRHVDRNRLADLHPRRLSTVSTGPTTTTNLLSSPTSNRCQGATLLLTAPTT